MRISGQRPFRMETRYCLRLPATSQRIRRSPFCRWRPVNRRFWFVEGSIPGIPHRDICCMARRGRCGRWGSTRPVSKQLAPRFRYRRVWRPTACEARRIPTSALRGRSCISLAVTSGRRPVNRCRSRETGRRPHCSCRNGTTSTSVFHRTVDEPRSRSKMQTTGMCGWATCDLPPMVEPVLMRELDSFPRSPASPV